MPYILIIRHTSCLLLSPNSSKNSQKKLHIYCWLPENNQPRPNLFTYYMGIAIELDYKKENAGKLIIYRIIKAEGCTVNNPEGIQK